MEATPVRMNSRARQPKWRSDLGAFTAYRGQEVSATFRRNNPGQIYGGFSGLGAWRDDCDFEPEQALSFAREMFGAFESIAIVGSDGTSVQ